MNCKNCNTHLAEQDKFCSNCGGKIVNARLTFKGLLKELSTNIFSWDNRFFVTLKNLLIKPELVLGSYISGVRKKFTNPLSFLAICAAIGALMLNILKDPYLEVLQEQTMSLIEGMTSYAGDAEEIYDDDNPFKDPTSDDQVEGQRQVNLFMLQHFYLISFLFLPFYTLISKIVYRKPYNFAEHLVFNGYLQGTMIIANLFLIGLSLLIKPSLFWLFYPLTIIYYLYAFARFYKHNFQQILLKFLKFIGVLLLILLIYLIIVIIIAVIAAVKSKAL